MGPLEEDQEDEVAEDEDQEDELRDELEEDFGDLAVVPLVPEAQGHSEHLKVKRQVLVFLLLADNAD